MRKQRQGQQQQELYEQQQQQQMPPGGPRASAVGEPKRNTARGRAEDKTVKEPKSQLKTNQAAMTIKCKVCLQPFMKTQSPAQLSEHAKNKHSKTLEECFPEVSAS
ncbi:hypothetical protein Esti_000136 [Eimeria stiedai]